MTIPRFPFAVRHRWIALAGILVLGVLVGYLAMPHGNVIMLKDDGFHPRTLTIKAGETVTFKTKHGKYFWPASDFHPTHTLHPEFDPKEPIAPNATWSHTFDTPGIFKFHDHLGAYYSGVITVTDENGKVVDDCMAHGGVTECWQNKIFIALATKGVDAAYDTITELFRTEPGFGQACHFLSHNVGLASYQFYRENPSFILSPKAIACAAGFYHGFMEGYLGATGDPAGAAQVCDAIGTAVSKDAPDARLQCFHGIGHGAIETAVASSGVFTTPDEAVATAVKTCEAASGGEQERYRCVSGVYNAIANFYIAGEYNLSITTSDPLQVCAHQPEVYKEACYGNMNSIGMWKEKNDAAKALAYMLTIPDVAYRAMAVQYTAGLAAVPYVGTDKSVEPILSACRAISAQYRLDCVRGFVHGLEEHGQPGAQHVQALAFCGNAALRTDERETCYHYVLSTLPGWYSQQESVEICEAIAPELKKYCTFPH